MLKLTPFFFLSFSLSYNTFKHKLFDFISAFIGERLIQFASENLVTEILIHPQYNTLIQCMRNLLSSFTRHRHIIHSGYTFSGNGSWILQVCMRAISTQFHPSPSIFLLYVLISITQLDCFVLLFTCVPHFGLLKLQNRMPRFRYWISPKRYKTTKCSVWCVHTRTLYRWKFIAPRRIGINCPTNRMLNCAKFVSIRWIFSIRAMKNSTHLSVSIFTFEFEFGISN